MGTSQAAEKTALKKIEVKPCFRLPRCVCFYGGWTKQLDSWEKTAHDAAQVFFLGSTGAALPFGLPILVDYNLHEDCEIEIGGRPELMELNRKHSRWLIDNDTMPPPVGLYSYRAETVMVAPHGGCAELCITFFRIFTDDKGQHRTVDVLETRGHLIPKIGRVLVPATVDKHELGLDDKALG